ncbi:protein of unknown function [Paraburkholderia kururiensis]
MPWQWRVTSYAMSINIDIHRSEDSGRGSYKSQINKVPALVHIAVAHCMCPVQGPC